LGKTSIEAGKEEFEADEFAADPTGRFLRERMILSVGNVLLCFMDVKPRGFTGQRRKDSLRRNVTMKAIAPILVALVFVASASAGVVVTCSASGKDVTISYDRNDATERIRAFALDITVDNGATIDSVSGLNPDYDIYPGSIVIDGAGNVTDVGTPIADVADAPSDTLGGLTTGGVTIEMGSLYASGDPAPPDTGDLLTLTVSGACNVTITENVIRGGIVLEDPAVPANPSFTGCAVSDVCKGDATGNGSLNTDDMNDLLVYLFLNGDDQNNYEAPLGPYPMMDLDGNQVLNTDDMNALLVHLFLNGDDQNNYEAPCVP
jgi:hypothetical protein